MNLMKFSRPCSHFGIIFEQEEGKRGIPLYQTWHIVNSITLYHLTSHSISELHIHINRRYYTAVRRYEFHLRVVNTILYERAQRVSKIVFTTRR